MPAVTVPGATTVAQLDAHLAVPGGDGPWPGVVVLHEAFGLNRDTRDQCERLAAAGYLTVAPDLFTAGGPRCLVSTFGAMLRGSGDAFGDIDATRDWLTARPDCTGRVGVIGFCLGGGFALAAAPRGFDVAAPNYGRMPAGAPTMLAGSCPVVASYGARDPSLRGAAATLETALTDLGVPHDVKEYPGASHSFLSLATGPMATAMRVMGVGAHEPSATDAWERILRYLDRYLRQPG